MKCINCKWEGEDTVGPLNHCPICGDNTTGSIKKEKDINLDLNNDGKVDGKDASIASKVMNAVKSKKKKVSKKKGKK